MSMYRFSPESKSLIAVVVFSLIILPMVFIRTHNYLKELNRNRQSKFLGKIVSGFETFTLILLRKPSPRGFTSEPFYMSVILLFFVALAALVITIILNIF